MYRRAPGKAREEKMYLSKRVGLLITGLTLASCTLIGGPNGQGLAEDATISAVINSPADNTEVAVGQEIMVQITINDPASVVNQQELRVDGVAVARAATHVK